MAKLIKLEKTPSGIRGVDEITGGGLPKGRPALVCGSAGCGKTLFGMEFLVRGAVQYHEPGVFAAFEETEEELARNVSSLGFDLHGLIARRKLRVEYIRLERSEIEETGEYDLQGLFIRLGHAIDAIGAKRVVLDTIEVLFSGLANHAIVRAELRRLFRWLKDKGVTAIVTAEKGSDNTLTRYGLEEYVADCVIALDHRIDEQISTRRLRIVKYRGSCHGTNEYPFLIGKNGISVMPVTSTGLSHHASRQRITTGVPRIDAMLGGNGFYRGSAVLVSGMAGTGKTSVAASFALSVCRRGERCLYFAFEESASQIMRNMRSIGLRLEPWVNKRLLRFHAVRSTTFGLESHLAQIQDLITDFQPSAVIVDPITGLDLIGDFSQIRSMLERLIDFIKTRQITLLCTSLTAAGDHEAKSEAGVSSVMDTWLLVRNLETGGERNRCLYVLKSRGMAHSNQVREFVLTGRGVQLVDVYVGQGNVLAGSARLVQLERERAEAQSARLAAEARRREIERKRAVSRAGLAALQAELEAQTEELKRLDANSASQTKRVARVKAEVARSRMADNKHAAA